MNKKVSVIIPAYNAELYIDKCIRSVMQQTYDNIEIIVVNDGSTDQTIRLLRKISEEDGRLIIVDQNNAGASAARNSGLKVCLGDYVFFLDSDDWIERNCLEILVSEIERENADIVFFDYYKVFSDKKVEHHVYKERKTYELNNDGGVFLYDMRTITPWGKLYSRKAIQNILYDEKMRTAEDVDFNFRVYQNVNKAVFLTECLLNYRILKQSAIHGYDSNVEKKFEYPLRVVASYLKDKNRKLQIAYYSFAAISYIVICQNGICLDNKITIGEKRDKIKALNKSAWVKDLFSNIKFVRVPFSRKSIILSGKFRLYMLIVFAVSVRKNVEK